MDAGGLRICNCESFQYTMATMRKRFPSRPWNCKHIDRVIEWRHEQAVEIAIDEWRRVHQRPDADREFVIDQIIAEWKARNQSK